MRQIVRQIAGMVTLTGMKRIIALAAPVASAVLASSVLTGLTGLAGPAVALASTTSPGGSISCPKEISPIAGCMRTVEFNMPAWSSKGTEVSGPALASFELVLYRGGIYQVASVRGAAFTLKARGRLFVNRGRALYHARAYAFQDAVTNW